MGTDDFFAGLDETKQKLRQVGAGGAEDRWRVLYEISSLFNSPVYTFEEILEIILDMAIKITEADRGLLLLYDDSEALSVKLAKDMDFSTLAKEEREVSESIIQDVVKSEQGICIANVENDAKFSELSSIIDLKILSVMCVPLKVTLRDERVGGKEHRAETLTTRKILGVLYVDSRSVTKSFSAADLELFQALANNATTAILNSNLYRLATCDAATGIYTRAHFEQRLRDELKLATKTASPLAILMVDIDHLRRVNAERGYAEADTVIAKVAQLIQGRIRGIDLAARYGGGKFVVILPQTDQQGTEQVANKILGAVAGETFFGRIGSITSSVGAAQLTPDGTSAGIVKRADLALYDAKRSGRNTFRMYHDGLASTAKRTDLLAGVLSGEPTRDYRNTLMLLETIEEINRRTDFDALLPLVVDTIVDITDADRGLLFLQDDDGNLLPRIARDRKKNSIEAKDFSRSVLDRVVETNQAVREAFTEQDGGVSSQSISNFAIRAVMCVPLVITDPNKGARTLGAVYVDSQSAGDEFDESSLAFFSTLSRQVAVAIENARLYDRVAALNRQLQHKLDNTVAELADVRVELEDRTRNLELRFNYDNIVGQSTKMQDIFRLLDRITDTNVPVFIHGESGTGKELVAKAIHYNGPRRKYRMISENCAATSETLLESELFGYVRGAFTGAQNDRKGLFELASKGTLFLDEVGDMSLGMQKKLLRVLQEGEIRRVGGKDTIMVDVRIVSASNKDLKALCDQGKFREDLYYRLNVVKVDLPPLRDRKEDLPLLIKHFLDEEATGPAKSFDGEAMQMLMRYNWPGNIRELKNVVERAKIISDNDLMTKDGIILDTVYDPRSQAGMGALGAGRSPLGPGGRSLPPSPGMPEMPPEPYYFDLNERQRKLIEYLKTYGSIRNRDYYEIMQVSKSTGWRDIKDLIERQILASHGKGKGSIYTLNDKQPTST